MLQVTHGAAALLTELRRTQDVPDTYGLRVFPEASNPGEVTIAIAFAEEPVQGDQVTEAEGLQVFVASELAGPLEDTAIDVTDANGDSRLVFRPQSETAPPA